MPVTAYTPPARADAPVAPPTDEKEPRVHLFGNQIRWAKAVLREWSEQRAANQSAHSAKH